MKSARPHQIFRTGTSLFSKYFVLKIHNLFHACPIWKRLFDLFGLWNYFLEFSVILKLDTERLCLKLPIIDKYTESNGCMDQNTYQLIIDFTLRTKAPVTF